MEKICSKCGASKLTTEFYAHKETRDKLQSWCKQCVRAAQKRTQTVVVYIHPENKPLLVL